MLRLLSCFLCATVCSFVFGQGAATSVGVDVSGPWYPDKDFPKLITPQWVGEEGVECVVVLAIDDMRDTAKYEHYLRPILNRLKQIDGRAPVSIMTNEVKPDDPQLQSWLEEGLSIECHTIDHPCPILQGGDFDKAKSTYDRCVDLLAKIPGSKPVAFRTPCCDSLNTVSPRFYSEIFPHATSEGNFLQIDSSVMNFFTSEDDSIPRELVLDENGDERFLKYKVKGLKRGETVHNNFVNYITNYPYPYLINNTCWQFPCVAPSDWSAQHLHGINNQQTVDDWKAALDITVHKQGVFNLVFHPHGWIKSEQVVELIDHAVAKHGGKVKFLNFREAADRLNTTILKGSKRSKPDTFGEQFRLLDVNRDSLMDAVVTLDGSTVTRLWNQQTSEWIDSAFPAQLQSIGYDLLGPISTNFGVFDDSVVVAFPDPDRSITPPASDAPSSEVILAYWPKLKFACWQSGAWQELPGITSVTDNLSNWDGRPLGSVWEQWVDLNSDGKDEYILMTGQFTAGPYTAQLMVGRLTDDGKMELREAEFPLPYYFNKPAPSKSVGEDSTGADEVFGSTSPIALVDLNDDGHLDLLLADETVSGAWLWNQTTAGWTTPVARLGSADSKHTTSSTRLIQPISVDVGTDNGLFTHDGHLCWQNENTDHLPDLIHRVSFQQLMDEHELLKQCETQPPVPIGAAVVDITPDYPVRLSGYGNRTKETDVVASKIHARALAIGGAAVVTGDSAAKQRQDVAPGVSPGTESAPNAQAPEGRHTKSQVDSNTQNTPVAPSGLSSSSGSITPGSRPELNAAVPSGLAGTEDDVAAQPLSILITVDNCGVPENVTEAVFKQLAEKFNITRERFAISSSHSHSAPWLRGFAPNILIEVPEDHAKHLANYEAWLIEQLVQVAADAISKRRPGRLSMGRGTVDFAINRRLMKAGAWTGFGETPKAPVDHQMPLLAAVDTDGTLIAVLANYACHATTETGQLNSISGDWPGIAASEIEELYPGVVALIAIGCGADSNPSPRGTHELAQKHATAVATKVRSLLWGLGIGSGSPKANHRKNAPDTGMRPVDHRIDCQIARIDLPLEPLPTREEWEAKAKLPKHAGVHGRMFLNMLDEGKSIPTTIPNYPVQTWCFGEDLAMVFLGGEVVIDYSVRMNNMFDSDRLWINAYSNDVPCYIASKRILREGGYEADTSMIYYARPTRLAPEAEDLICDTVQKLLPHHFYSKELQASFPAPKSPEESLAAITVRSGLRAELVASEPLINDPVAFDWDINGRLWVVEMGGYPETPRGAVAGNDGLLHGTSESPSALNGEANVGVTVPVTNAATAAPSPNSAAGSSTDRPSQNQLAGGRSTAGAAAAGRLKSADEHHRDSDDYVGRVRVLEDTDGDGRYDKAVTFLDGLSFPTGLHPWRNGWLITCAPDIIYAEDTDGDFVADKQTVLYTGFTEGNQQHRINGMRWGLDGWLYLANGDSGGEVRAVGRLSNDESEMLDQPINIRGRDIRIHPDTGAIETLSGQSQFGRNRDDFGNWFGNNNSNPIWHYVLEDRYLKRNPFAIGLATKAEVAEVPGAAPAYPTSKTLARFNDFHAANRFTSACSTAIYRDNLLGEEFYGNAFTCEPVHNLVSRLVLERDGATFKGRRAYDEQTSEFFASSDNWTRPVMVRTGPDGALYIADMYRQVIEHPEWIPAEYQRKMDLYAGNTMGRIYRIVKDEAIVVQSQTGRESAEGWPGLDRAERRKPRGFARASLQPRPPTQEQQSSSQLQQEGGSFPVVPTTGTLSDFLNHRWQNIPLAGLLQLFERSNGWWRDTAQRILWHRREELYALQIPNPFLPVNNDGLTDEFKQKTSLYKLTVASTISEIMKFGTDERETHVLAGLAGLNFHPLLNDPDPEIRRLVIPLMEHTFFAGTDGTFDTYLKPLASDKDSSVRMQLMLSLGYAKRRLAGQLLGQMLRDNFDDLNLRNAGLSSLTDANISQALAVAMKGSAGKWNDQLVSLLLIQASRFQLRPGDSTLPLNDRKNLFSESLERFVRASMLEASASRLQLVAKTLQAIAERYAEVLETHRGLQPALEEFKVLVRTIALDKTAEAEQRAAALECLGIVSGIKDLKLLNLSEFIDVQVPKQVQTTALRMMARFADPERTGAVLTRWKSYSPGIRAELINPLLQRSSGAAHLLAAIESAQLSATDFDAVTRERLLNHKDSAVREAAQRILGVTASSSRTALVQNLKSEITGLKTDATAGKAVFEKRCATCHAMGNIGKQIGANLAALKDRSTDALLTAILDPNRAVEAKFLSYTAVTTNGRTFSGMLLSETGNSLTLLGTNGKQQIVARTDLEELVCSNRSLMPEGLEKDISAQEFADVISFIQTSGSTYKTLDGNSPRLVTPNPDGTITLSADLAEIYGPSLIFEHKHQNLGWWSSTDDYAVWNLNSPRSGMWTVEVDYACDNSTAGNVLKLSTGTRLLSARVPGTGTWDDYKTWTVGKIDLGRGARKLTVTAPEKPKQALIDLKAIRLIPPQ